MKQKGFPLNYPFFYLTAVTVGIRESSKFRILIKSHTNAIGENQEKAWPSGVVLNVMQIQTITAGCQCKQETKSRSLMQAMHGILIVFFKVRYLARKLFANLYNRSTNLHMANKFKFELAGTGKSWKNHIISRSQPAFPSKFG